MIESWLATLQSFSKIWIGFSGGLDSAVLLDNLAAYQSSLPPIHAIHIHHGISVNADLWQSACASFCERLAIPFFCQKVDFDRSANVEEGARSARYEVFASQLQAGEALLLAHHADDQAETLLLQLFRGAGITGLAAMPEITAFAAGTLVRPLLNYSRKDLEKYAESKALTWVEDESNMDERYSRNYLRHALFPIIEQKWPAVVHNLNRSAKHCQDALSNLEALASLDLAVAADGNKVLSMDSMRRLPKPRLINLLRYWFKKNQIVAPSTLMMRRIYEEFFESKIDANPQIAFERLCLRRYQEKLYLTEKDVPNLPQSTSLSDAKELSKLNSLLGYNVQALIEKSGFPLLADRKTEIRFRQGGEILFWHGQHKDLKKLLQEWKILPWMRNRMPLLYVDGVLVAVLH